MIRFAPAAWERGSIVGFKRRIEGTEDRGQRTEEDPEVPRHFQKNKRGGV